jgi:hypothetical protein
MSKREHKKIYKGLVQSTTGIWNKGDGLAYQEKLRAGWDDQSFQGYHLLKPTDEDNLRS